MGRFVEKSLYLSNCTKSYGVLVRMYKINEAHLNNNLHTELCYLGYSIVPNFSVNGMRMIVTAIF